MSRGDDVPLASSETPGRHLLPSRWLKHQNPGSLVFGLEIGETGELEYRGSTSSATGLSFPKQIDQTHQLTGTTLGQPLLQSHDIIEHHIELFLEWQNSSIIIVTGFQADRLFKSSAKSSLSPGTHLLLLSIMALTSQFLPGQTWAF